MTPKLPGARCSECPLKDLPYVGGAGPDHPKLIVLEEQPRRSDVEEKIPFFGEHGHILDKALAHFGAKRGSMYLSYAIACQSYGKRSPEDWKQAARCCAPRLSRELVGFDSSIPIVGCGEKTLWQQTGKGKLASWVGAPLQLPGNRTGIFLPPLRLTLSKPWYKPVIASWLLRAWRLALGQEMSWKWPKFVIQPGLEMIRELERLSVTQNPVGFDVETAGLDPRTADLLCVGLADKDGGASIPWPPPSDEYRRLLSSIMENRSITKVAHNAQHDLLSLGYVNPTVLGTVEDTLFAHAIVAPQLPHDLGFCAAMEFAGPRWKTEFQIEGDLKGSDRFIHRDQAELRLYNVKDAYMTALLWPKLQERLAAANNGWELYVGYRDFLPLVLNMRNQGIWVAKARRDAHRVQCLERLKHFEEAFSRLTANLPAAPYKMGLNGQHGDLKQLFFKDLHIQPTSFSRETGEPTLDAQALQAIVSTAESSEAQLIARALLAYRRWYKLYSTYVEGLEVGSDGRARSTWKVHGTLTGRWSSASPNMQNIPKAKEETKKDGTKIPITPSLRDMFVRYPGHRLIECDFSQLELRIMALLAQDKKLLEWYKAGEDVHSLNAKALFGKNFDKKQRDLAKRLAYAFNYNNSEDISTVWSSLVVDFPSLKPVEVRKLRKRWFEEHPEIAQWQKEQVALAHKTDYVEELLSGRREYFFDKIEPNKVLNYPIQGFAGTLMNRAIMGLFKELDPNRGRIVLQVHDAIVCEVRLGHEEYCGKLMKSHMEQTIELNGLSMKFPVDAKIGKNWADMKEIIW